MPDQLEDLPDDYDPSQELEDQAAADDENDVPAALEKETADGKGGAVVPKSDFDSFAESDVEIDDEDKDHEEG